MNGYRYPRLHHSQFSRNISFTSRNTTARSAWYSQPHNRLQLPLYNPPHPFNFLFILGCEEKIRLFVFPQATVYKMRKLQMTSFTNLSILLVVAAMSVFMVAAQNQFKVGGAGGWRVPDENNPDIYAVWARNLRFQVGDSILFEYKNDSVNRVEKTGYYHCNESTHDTVSKDGNTIFLFDKPGLFYFVSGNFEHCKEGQRLMVDVMDSHGSAFQGAPGPSPVSSAATDSGSAASFHLAEGLMVLSVVFIMNYGLRSSLATAQ